MQNDDTVAQLVESIQNGIDTDANKLLLWVQLEKLARFVAYRYSERSKEPDYAFEEDTGEAYIVLLETLADYDKTKCKFSTYYSERLKYRFLKMKYCNNSVYIPRGTTNLELRYYKTIRELTVEYRKEPTEKEICKMMGISEQTLERIKESIRARYPTSMDVPIAEDDGTTLKDTIASETNLESDAIEKVYQEELKEHLWGMVDKTKYAKEVRKHFMYNQTYTDIAKELGVSHQLVRDRVKSSVREIKASSGITKLRSFAEHLIEARAYKGVGFNEFNRTGISSTERDALFLIDPDWNKEQ